MTGDGRFVVTWDSKGQDDGGSQGIYRPGVHRRRRARRRRAPGQHDHEQRSDTTPRSRWTTAAATSSRGAARERATPNGVFWRRFAVAAPGTITGTVYHDIDGDGNLAGAATFAGAVVRLSGTWRRRFIDPADTLLPHDDHRRRRRLHFSGLALGTYYVVVDSRTLGAPNVWAEQTYGSAGSALGAGFTAGAGALFGGRERTRRSDDRPPALTDRRARHEGHAHRRRRRRRRRLRLQLQRGDEQRATATTTRQPEPLGAGLAPPVHPERERHRRRADRELLDRRRRAADDPRRRRRCRRSRSPTRSCSTRARKRASRAPRSSN